MNYYELLCKELGITAEMLELVVDKRASIEFRFHAYGRIKSPEEMMGITEFKELDMSNAPEEESKPSLLTTPGIEIIKKLEGVGTDMVTTIYDEGVGEIIGKTEKLQEMVNMYNLMKNAPKGNPETIHKINQEFMEDYEKTGKHPLEDITEPIPVATDEMEKEYLTEGAVSTQYDPRMEEAIKRHEVEIEKSDKELQALEINEGEYPEGWAPLEETSKAETPVNVYREVFGDEPEPAKVEEQPIVHKVETPVVNEIKSGTPAEDWFTQPASDDWIKNWGK